MYSLRDRRWRRQLLDFSDDLLLHLGHELVGHFGYGDMDGLSDGYMDSFGHCHVDCLCNVNRLGNGDLHWRRTFSRSDWLLGRNMCWRSFGFRRSHMLWHGLRDCCDGSGLFWHGRLDYRCS
jgi:hypothetical protein